MKRQKVTIENVLTKRIYNKCGIYGALMRFRALPFYLHVGSIDLREEDAHRGQWPACQYCGFVSVKFFKCFVGSHAICSECVLASNIGGDETRKAWCRSCGDWALLRKSTIPLDALSEAMFTCGCGFRGTLVSIRQHLREAPDPRSCFKAPQCCERDLNDRSNLQNELNLVKEQLAKSNAQPLMNRVDQPGEFIQSMRVLSESGHWVEHLCVAGVPLKVRLEIHSKNEKFWLGLGIAGSTHLETHRDAWPLKKLILLTVRNDAANFTVTRGIRTCRENRFVSDTFIQPADTSNTVGWRFFCSFDDVFQGSSNDSFTVHVSLRDLPER